MIWQRGGRSHPSAHPIDLGDGWPDGLWPARVVGVTGAPGAPGKSFISVNLAVWLAERGLSVCLVDADPGLGTVAFQLNLDEERSLAYLDHAATLLAVDDELLDRHLQHYRSLTVLTGRLRSDQGLDPAAGRLPAVLGLLRRRHQLLVVDLGALTSQASAATALECTQLVWVVDPSPLGADLFDRTVTSPLVAPLRLGANLAVVNGVGPGSLGGAEATLPRRYGIQVAGSVPHQRRASLEAESSHRPAVLGGPLSEPLRRVAEAVAAAAVHPLESDSAGVKATSPPSPVGAALERGASP